MKTEERRERIRELLRRSDGCMKGIDLACVLGVSRQVIVQDIAILRAGGERIIATPRGYALLSGGEGRLQRTIVTRHRTMAAMEDELRTIVDDGGRVLDVIVEHPIYGEIRGNLMLSSRLDVEDFMKKIVSEEAEPLSRLTDGVHIHTVEVPDERTFARLVDDLRKKGYLLNPR